VVRAWQAEVLRRAVRMNREGDHRAAGHYLKRELGWMERYARGVPDTEALLAELVLVQCRAGEVWDERTRKGVFAMTSMAAWSEVDLREAALAKTNSSRTSPSEIPTTSRPLHRVNC
jgi:hypothetical protein